MENISAISIELGIRRIKNAGNKARCFKSLDETFSDIAHKRDAPIQISEDIINFIETTNNNALKLNPQKIAWVKEWAQIKTEKHSPLIDPKYVSLRAVIQRFITKNHEENETIKQGIISVSTTDTNSDFQEEVQDILDIKTGKNAPSKELLDFIIFKKRNEFSTLFQTIINNHISDGLERAAITYIIYKSSMFNSKKYHEWKPFYRQFCEDIDWKVTTYKPYRLTDIINSLKSKFFWIDAIK